MGLSCLAYTKQPQLSCGTWCSRLNQFNFERTNYRTSVSAGVESRRHGKRAFVRRIDLAVIKELDSAGKVCVFESYQGVLDSSLGFPIVRGTLEFCTLKGSINSIPLGRTYWIKGREGVAYRTNT